MLSLTKYRLLAATSILISLSLLAPQESIAAAKAGTKCLKVGQTATVANKKFTCIKSGKNLVWNKGVLVPIKATPVQSPSATPKPTSTPTPTPVLDSHNLVIQQVTNDWKRWAGKATSNYTPLKIFIEPGYDLNWSIYPTKSANYLISIFVGNGHLLVQDPLSIIGDTESWIKSAGEPFSCGSKLPEMALGIYCGRIQAGYGYFLLELPDDKKFADGTVLTKKELIHLSFNVVRDLAIMYELQAQYGSAKYDGKKNQIPAWIRQGFVQLFSALAIADAEKSNSNYYQFALDSGVLESFKYELCPKTLQDFESKDRNWGDSCMSSQNLYGVELLVARHGGLEALFNFVSLFGVSDDWPVSFKSAFGISREEFYSEWYDYLKIPTEKRPALKPPAPSAHY